MSCTRCGDVCNCITIQSADGQIGITKSQNGQGCIFTLSLLADTDQPVPFYLTFDNATRNLCVKDNTGTTINCVTIPGGEQPQTLSIAGNVLSISGGNSITLPAMPNISVLSSTLEVNQSGAQGQNINIEMVPSTQAGNSLTLGTDGKPYVPTPDSGAKLSTDAGNLSTLGSDNGIYTGESDVSAALLADQTFKDSINAGVTKQSIGLGNVDNTSDANKPISTAQQAEFDALQQQIQDAATSSVIGSITSETQSPTGSEVTGNAYRVSINAEGSEDIELINFPTDTPVSSGNVGVIIPAGTSGVITKQADGNWVYDQSAANVDTTQFTLKGGYIGTSQDLDNSKMDLDDYTLQAENLVDPDSILSGSYDSVGNTGVSDNWIRIPPIVLDTTQTEISISGTATIQTNQVRAVIKNLTGDVISVIYGNALTEQTIPIIADSYNIFINVANAVDIGLNPTNSPYRNTLMLNYGLPVAYQPYGFRLIKQSAIEDIDNLALSGGTESTLKEVEDSSELTTTKLNSITINSNNLLDYSLVQGGNYGLGTSITFSENWIAYPKIPVNEGEVYTISGVGAFSTSGYRFIYISSTDEVVSRDNSNFDSIQTTQPIPAGVAYLGINLANELSIGNTPTNNAYTNTAMLNLGNSALPYQHYGTLINRNSVDGLNIIETDIDSNTRSIQLAEDKLDVVMQDYTIFGRFNGVTSEIPLDNTLSISLPGDYFEFEARGGDDWVNYKDGLGMFGVTGSAYTFGIYTTNSYGLRCSSSSSYIFFDNLPSLIGEWYKIKVQVSDDGNNWEFYLNDILNQTKPKISTEEFRILNIGNAYLAPDAFATFDLKYVNIKSGGTQLSIQEPSSYPSEIDVQPIYEKKSSVEDGYPKTIVKFTPFTGTYDGTLISQEIVTVYEQINEDIYNRNSIFYQRLDFADYVSGDFHGGEIVRFAGAKLVSFNKETKVFTDLSSQIIITPESEFVLNSAGWSSGYHGNEIFSNVYFIIDGKPYNDGTINFSASDLIYCDSFSYTQASTLYLDSNKSELANKKKIVEFENGAYKVNIKLKLLQALSMLIYSGIVCVSKFFTNVLTDTSTEVTLVGDSSFPVEDDILARKVIYSNEDYNLSVSNTTINSDLDLQSAILVWDRATDTKYYRNITYTPEVNSYFDTTTTVVLKTN